LLANSALSDSPSIAPGPGSHEVWRNALTGRKVTLPHHARDMAEGTLRAILREAGINVDEFLKA
jgi:hypothetical protein